MCFVGNLLDYLVSLLVGYRPEQPRAPDELARFYFNEDRIPFAFEELNLRLWKSSLDW